MVAVVLHAVAIVPEVEPVLPAGAVARSSKLVVQKETAVFG